MNEVLDLWPDFQKEEIRSPKTILKEQADLLARKTNNILLGEVGLSNPIPIEYDEEEHYDRERLKATDPFYQENLIEKYGKEIGFAFRVKAIKLGGYSYTLFSGKYRVIEFYPAFIEENSANDEKQFLELIRKQLNDPETKKIINSLYSQSLEEVK